VAPPNSNAPSVKNNSLILTPQSADINWFCLDLLQATDILLRGPKYKMLKYQRPAGTGTHLNLLVAEGEPGCRRQEPNHDAGQRQDAGAHRPVEGGDAGRGVLAGVTALGVTHRAVNEECPQGNDPQ